jgi:hypothetical protein
MPAYPKPHSIEWFRDLAKSDPRQAAHTRQIIERAGREDVCSVCGDDPSKDYKIVKPQPHADAVATLRLCNDCLDIRVGRGEEFVAFAH